MVFILKILVRRDCIDVLICIFVVNISLHVFSRVGLTDTPDCYFSAQKICTISERYADGFSEPVALYASVVKLFSFHAAPLPPPSHSGLMVAHCSSLAYRVNSFTMIRLTISSLKR